MRDNVPFLRACHIKKAGKSLTKILMELIEGGGYTLSQVFNADETGLWWKLMPSRTFVHCGEVQAKNFKKLKDRVTLMGCSNATGICKLPQLCLFIKVLDLVVS